MEVIHAQAPGGREAANRALYISGIRAERAVRHVGTRRTSATPEGYTSVTP